MNIKINLELLNNNQPEISKKDILGTLKNNIINFEFDNITHQIDLEEEIFTRENSEYIFTINLKNYKSSIFLKQEQLSLEIPVEQTELIKTTNTCLIKYLIETDDEIKNLKLTWEEK